MVNLLNLIIVAVCSINEMNLLLCLELLLYLCVNLVSVSSAVKKKANTVLEKYALESAQTLGIEACGTYGNDILESVAFKLERNMPLILLRHIWIWKLSVCFRNCREVHFRRHK